MALLKKIFLVLSKRERIIFLVATVLAIVSGSVLGGLGFINSTKPVPASGGEFLEGALGQPVYVNPVIASSEIDKSLVRLLFSNMNDLTDKIEAQGDGRTWKIRLKENLRWHDGVKLTSDDVIFTIQKIQDRESSSPLFQAWQGVAIQRLSELELQVSLINPYAFFQETLNNLYILPKHLFADVPTSNWRISDYNLKPVGSGPYKFDSYEKQADGFIYFYKLQSWDKYFGDKPFIQNFNFEFFAQKDDLIQKFNLGQIDGIAAPETEDLIKIKRPYETVSFRLPNYYAVFLNQSKSVPLKDASVRAALNLALDRDNLINEVLGGRGKPAFGPIPYGEKYFNPNMEPATTSPEEAIIGLEKSGWKLNASDLREKTIGATKIPLELNLLVPQIEFLTKTAALLQEAWQKIGIKININTEPPEDVLSAIKNRDYEMLLFGNVLGRSEDLFSFWHSSERFYPGLNLALYNNKKVDAFIESIRQNLDEEKRRVQFDQLQGLIIQDLPAIFLYSPDYIYIANKNLRGLDTNQIAEPADIFAKTGGWYLKTARVLK